MNKAVTLLAIGGAAAYLTRDKWMPSSAPAATTGSAGAAGTNPQQIGVTTGVNTPIGAQTAGAVALGNGCYSYPTGTAGSTVITCPPGVNPPPVSAPPNNCSTGFTLDAGGVCTRYPDAVLLANLNTLPWSGLTDIPAEQIQRIDPQILGQYSATIGVNGGTILAYLLGLGTGQALDGTMMNGSDGYAYRLQGGVFYRQGTGTRLTGLRNIARALPISQGLLVEASANPQIAALIGNDPRALLTPAQWNLFYTQASGVLQHADLSNGQPRVLISALEYQHRRRATGLETAARLGTLRPARRGAFPLGSINQWIPPGNRTIYQIPGRGAVPAGRGGMIPPAKPFARLGTIQNGGGRHRWKRSPFPRPSDWREYIGEFPQ